MSSESLTHGKNIKIIENGELAIKSFIMVQIYRAFKLMRTNIMKHTPKIGLSTPFLLLLFCICSLFTIEQRIWPDKTIIIEQARNSELDEAIRTFGVSRDISYKDWLSPKSFKLLQEIYTYHKDFFYFVNALADNKAYIGVAKTVHNLTAGIILTRDLPNGALFIDYLFVLPEYQSLKIGAKLIAHVTNQAKQKWPQQRHIAVECHKENVRGVNFYLRQGFKIVTQYPEQDYTIYVFLKSI